MNDNEEQRIKNAIITWIRYQPRKGFAWSQYNGAVYDVKRQCFRKRSSFARKGVPDIIGIWCRRPLFIEVKKPGGVVSDDQKKFIREARSHGGIAIVVYSYDQAVKFLEQFNLPQEQQTSSLAPESLSLSSDSGT